MEDLYACAEFGTYPPLHVLARLRAEHQAHHWSPREAGVTHWAKHALRDAFCPRSPAWRQSVLQESYRLVERALEGVAGTGESING